MAKFLVLARCELQTPSGPRLCEAGEAVSFDGAPSALLHPLDREARALRAHVVASRNPQQQRRNAVLAARARRGLPRHVRKMLDQADAEAAAEGPVEPVPPVRRRSVPPPGTPATYPSSWSTRVNRLRSAVLNPR
jgi:hypothetical protein